MRTVFRDDHWMLQTQVARFVEQEILPYYAQWEDLGVTPRSLWRKAGANGLLNCAIPAPWGHGGDFGHAAVVIEEIARANCLGIGFSIHSDMVAPYILRLGTQEQKNRWLPRMTEGECIGAIAMTEPDAGSDLKSIRTRAKRSGRHYVLSGQKTFVTNGSHADLVLVLASTAPELGARGLSLFAVERGMPGFRQGQPLRKIGQHAQDTCELFFDDVQIPASHRLGDENAGFEYVTSELAQERLAIALRAAAHLEGMIESTCDYVKQRKAFGRRVMDFQNTRFTLSRAMSQSSMLRVFLDDCLARHMRGELDAVTAAMAKLNATEMQNALLDDMLQLFGGYGYMADVGIGRAWADARALRIFGGTSEIMNEIIGRSL
ncbi:acyl-CoA dehydrogenase family protein [Diaphorobacter ruginosibacter]|uniref:Acyl-[acyl-carrier-protein] dehydrogenase MbtN n=1 Tax=Diaphorobacter ruginosibacter TaxID=1715720 RepID=A0A7G9RPR4_9BURK|nr:acyl-CoA dehydrogenase family protein [Diaphorobacter ruginosibacter]QNN57589.1 acyl-CoA dehydrogenase family protein [Diaphorobacter ruginosibacter]